VLIEAGQATNVRTVRLSGKASLYLQIVNRQTDAEVGLSQTRPAGAQRARMHEISLFVQADPAGSPTHLADGGALRCPAGFSISVASAADGGGLRTGAASARHAGGLWVGHPCPWLKQQIRWPRQHSSGLHRPLGGPSRYSARKAADHGPGRYAVNASGTRPATAIKSDQRSINPRHFCLGDSAAYWYISFTATFEMAIHAKIQDRGHRE